MDALIDKVYWPAMPAPFWFIEFFKVLGFVLHALGMNLWYAGIIVSMLVYVAGGEHGRRWSARMMSQMPFVVAYGVTFGIVPLLFVQVAYSKVFYPATVLMAWFWLAIVLLLIPAYYGVYAYAVGLRGDEPMRPWRRAAGWLGALLFLTLGFFFANGFSLMAAVPQWQRLWESHNVAGAATGMALNMYDPTLWPRWQLMFGIALMTTAAWCLVDAAWFAKSESPQYRDWARKFAWKLHTVGVVWFGVAASWYVFGTWPAWERDAMLAWPTLLLTAFTVASPGLPWLLLFWGRRTAPTGARGHSILVGLAQLGVLATNAISRQYVQNLELRPYYDPSQRPVEVQLSPLVCFLVLFVLGLGVVLWMIAQVVRAEKCGVASEEV